MEHNLRNIKGSDIFIMSKILKKMKLKPEVQPGMTQQQLGVDLFVLVLENLHLAQNEINEFMADLAGMTKEEFASLDIVDTMEVFAKFKEQKGVQVFLKLLGK